LLSGCAVTKKAGEQMAHLTNQMKGEYYLQHGEYREGIATLKKALTCHPGDANLHYHLGRFYLALDKISPAYQYFHQASDIDPSKADYYFWLGVAYGELGWLIKERQAYRVGLKLDPDHPQALIYLGNNLLRNEEYQAALDMYQRALNQDPTNAQTLYNRAYVIDKLGRTPEAITAWKIYLTNYPKGQFARRAVHHLNYHGNYEYRVYLIGKRRLVIPRIGFYPLTARIEPATEASLDPIGQILVNNPKLVLQILAYQQNNLSLAKARALQMKHGLLDRYPGIAAPRIRASWFKVPQKLSIGDRTHRLDSSIHLFTTQ